MAATRTYPNEKLVYSTRWFNEEADQSDCPSPKIAVQIVIRDEERDERLAALSHRPTLFGFLKSDVRSHVAA